MTRLLCILTVCVYLSACAPENAVDYCRDHHLYHVEHLDSLGTFSIVMGADGVLSSELDLPPTVVTESTEALLQDPSSVYTLQTARDCTAATSEVRLQGNALTASYVSQCGLDNKIGQLDVVLFDNMASLEELEVDVVTPVAHKHFAISRQCDRAIFRLE